MSEMFEIRDGTLFKYLGKSRNIVIPNNVFYILENIFYKKRLLSVVIPSSVKEINSRAFMKNSLSSLIIPYGTQEIGFMAFAQNKLRSVVISKSVRTIGSFAFQDNPIVNLVISSNIEKIGKKIYNKLGNLIIENDGNIINFLEMLDNSFNLLLDTDIEITGNPLTEEEQAIIEEKYKRYNINYNPTSTSLEYTSNTELLDTSDKSDKDKEYVYKTPIDISSIKNMAFDLAMSKDLTNVIGRDTEIEKLIMQVCIKGSSVLLLGDAGVGKTAILESLALQVRNGTNKWLKDKVILSVDTSAVVSGARYVGMFEKQFNEVLNIAKRYKDRVILFIDEFHTLYGLGKGEASSLDAMNMLKPLISNRDITVIGATTIDEYQEYIASDKAFVRRFEQIKLDTLSLDLNIDILVDYMAKLERKYIVYFPYNERERRIIAKYIIEKTDVKYQRVVGTTPTTNPTLAKSILENAFVYAVYTDKLEVELKDICIAISSCDKLSNNTINPLNLESMLNIMPEDNKVVSFPKKM